VNTFLRVTITYL